MGLLLGTAVPFFWETWLAGQDSCSLTKPQREEWESLFWRSMWRSREDEKLKVLCSGSRTNKVGHFSLCNKAITVLSEKFFFFRMPPSPLPFHFEVFNGWESCYIGQKLKQALPYIQAMCVCKSSVFISIGKVPWGWALIKMFWAESTFTKWPIKVFWPRPDQGLVRDNSLFVARMWFSISKTLKLI